MVLQVLKFAFYFLMSDSTVYNILMPFTISFNFEIARNGYKELQVATMHCNDWIFTMTKRNNGTKY